MTPLTIVSLFVLAIAIGFVIIAKISDKKQHT